MFSMVESFAKALVNWKVRTMPFSASLCGGVPVMSLPSNVMVPESTRSKPVSRLKKVVLPAPFGPMSAVILLRRISTFSTSTARKPPNVFTTPVAVMIGVSGAPKADSTAVKGHLLS